VKDPKDKEPLKIPFGPLDADTVAKIQKKLGVPAAQLEAWAAEEPFQPLTALPTDFSTDIFLEQIATVYGVQKDERKNATKTLLTRTGTDGKAEQLFLLNEVTAGRPCSGLTTALPKGVKLWIGVALGLPPHAGASIDHEHFVAETYEKYGPQN
jgi:hypothetical protein